MTNLGPSGVSVLGVTGLCLGMVNAEITEALLPMTPNMRSRIVSSVVTPNVLDLHPSVLHGGR